MSESTRRGFLAAGAVGTLAAAPATANAAGGFGGQPRDGRRGSAAGPEPVKIPTMLADTEAKPGPAFTPLPPEERLGFAVVGLGELALHQVLPAFGRAKRCRLAALVSGDADKARAVASQYGIGRENLYDYKAYDRLADDPAVDVVYIILPNSMHLEFTSRAAAAGKHVLCEKPMATSAADCEAMIAACEKAKKQLMIAYRCQYEPHHREAIRLARSGELGPLRLIEATNGQNQGPPGQWRHRKALAGGGSLPDVGIYCLNAARYITGEEPSEVSAQVLTDSSDPRFAEVEDRIAFQLKFPSGVLADCRSYYSAHESRRCRVMAERGWIDMDPAFSYQGLRMKVARVERGAEHVSEVRLPSPDQFAAEMDHMAERAARGERPHTPGEEGLQDQRIIEAIYRAAREGRPVPLAAAPGRDATRGPAPG
ncbi:Glucose--fructose oxidoreductase precursor [Aquisphaera giovannonii]|uniref:Glucose--fructose oxidoreductase n=1 Tax=Aquisphaera giovannonii TaxID=406548 RepID=A0A5B9VVJ6_9BACT|nr:Gfo/Idh/MocA family oxidoreductase [Aquisphaera giovannonii]QEH32262.1 Glucose--fructose oxidoreductase precursor [Aquisphaera giovannonii]